MVAGVKVQLKQNTNQRYKWTVTFLRPNGRKKTIHFGAKGMSDYTIHKDPERKQRYINRHKKRENWNKSGIKTAGFWSLHLLWNKPSLSASIKDIENKFNVKIKKVPISQFPSRKSPRKSTKQRKSTKKSRRRR